MIEADTAYVDRAWRKHMRPCGNSLLRFRSLDALLKAATVRDTAEDAGDKLRVIHIAEASKHLVLVAQIIVTANIESVAVFVECGA